MFESTDKLILLICFLPYLGLALFDGWLHEKARRVPYPEQAMHALIALSVVALLWGLFRDLPWLALPSLAIFALAAAIDEFGFHGGLDRRERRLHHVAYACFAGFIGVAAWLGRLG